MKYEKLKRNLISVIKEAQIKLGFDSISFGVNYATASLCHLFDDIDESKLQAELNNFVNEYKDIFGEIEIAKIEMGYRLTVSVKGVEYVHSLLDENEFLYKFINEVRSPNASIDSIIEIFKHYSSDVHIEHLENNQEFDYLIYFENGTPDEFWYCIDTEDLGMTYHRFMKDDYLDFNF